MACYGCGVAFNPFKKEHGCKNCGFAFCTKCLSNKLPIAKMRNEKHRVCVKCYNILTGKVKPKEDDPAKYSPPENYKKRIAALEERESGLKSGAVTSRYDRGPRDGARVVAQCSGVVKADIELQQRLDKLSKKSPQEIAASMVTSQEIDNRLASLKGMDPSRYKMSNKLAYNAPDRRTQQEQMNDLLDEIGNEVELDSHLPDPAQEVAARLAKLKGQDKANIIETGISCTKGNANNLNKPSLRDSQTFSKNISIASKSHQGDLKPVDGSQGDYEVTPLELSRILNEAAHELKQDAQRALDGVQEDKEIMKKLQEIKQQKKTSSSYVNKDEEIKESCSENEDEEMATRSIINQVIEESKLDEAAARDGLDICNVSKESARNAKTLIYTEEWYDDDDLPYCCICAEDATVRCLGCDRDLYCNQCFKEGHKQLELTDHVTLKYTTPREKTHIEKI